MATSWCPNTNWCLFVCKDREPRWITFFFQEKTNKNKTKPDCFTKRPFFKVLAILTERPFFSLFSLSPKDPCFWGLVRTSLSLVSAAQGVHSLPKRPIRKNNGRKIKNKNYHIPIYKWGGGGNEFSRVNFLKSYPTHKIFLGIPMHLWDFEF